VKKIKRVAGRVIRLEIGKAIAGELLDTSILSVVLMLS
jgi:hypothetical protein